MKVKDLYAKYGISYEEALAYENGHEERMKEFYANYQELTEEESEELEAQFGINEALKDILPTQEALKYYTEDQVSPLDMTDVFNRYLNEQSSYKEILDTYFKFIKDGDPLVISYNSNLVYTEPLLDDKEIFSGWVDVYFEFIPNVLSVWVLTIDRCDREVSLIGWIDEHEKKKEDIISTLACDYTPSLDWERTMEHSIRIEDAETPDQSNISAGNPYDQPLTHKQITEITQKWIEQVYGKKVKIINVEELSESTESD